MPSKKNKRKANMEHLPALKRRQGRSRSREGQQGRRLHSPPTVPRTTRSRRSATLSVLRGHNDVLKFPVNEDRMRRVCPRWPRLKNMGAYEKKLEIEGMNFEDDKAKLALETILEIVHGNDNLDLKNADPRFLFYLTEIHRSLGYPTVTYSGNDKWGACPFFRLDLISRAIFDLAKQAGYLYRVDNWLLLAVVADRLRLEPVAQLVRDNLVLFCRMNQNGLPDEVRHSIKEREWGLIQRLRMIDDSLLDKRKFYVDGIFKGLRLLSHQVIYFEEGILPNEERFDTYQDYKVAACSGCYSVSSDSLHRELRAARLWPLCASSYADRVIDLIHAIREMEGKTLVGNHCNQLSHLYDHLRRLNRGSSSEMRDS